MKEIFEFVVRGRTGDLDDLREDIQKTADAVADYGDAANDTSGKSVKAERGILNLGKAANTALTAVKALAAAGLAGLLTVTGTAIHDVMALDSAMNKFEAQTGVTGSALEEYTDIAQELYGSNLGESMDDVVTALGQVRNISGESGAALTVLTEKGLILRDVFGYEIAESMRAADNASKAFGVDASEVLDFVTVAAQRTGDASGDLLDTVNEYGADFAEAGYSVDQMFAALVQGSEAGIFNLDKIGDSVREFGTRVQEGTDETKAAFDSLLKADTDGWLFKDYETGVDTVVTSSKELYAAIEAGTVPLSMVGDRVAATLGQIEDPIERNAVGVALLGSMYEDLGPSAFEALNIMDEGLQGIDGATKRAGEAMQQGLGPAWTRFTRGVRMGLVDAIGPFIADGLDALIPKLEIVGTWFKDKGIPSLIGFGKKIAPVVKGIGDWAGKNPKLIATLAAIAGVIATVVGVASALAPVFAAISSTVGVVSAAFGSFMAVAGTVATALSVPVLAVAGAFAAVVAAIVALGVAYKTNFLGFRDAVNSVAGSVGTALESIAGFVGKVVDAFQAGGLEGAASFLLEQISGGIQSVISYVLTEGPSIATNLLSAIGSGLGDVGAWFDTNFSGLVTTALSTAIAAGGAIYNAAVTYGPGILAAVGSGLTDVGTWILEHLINLWKAELELAITAGGAIYNAVVTYGPGILEAVGSGLGDVGLWVLTNFVSLLEAALAGAIIAGGAVYEAVVTYGPGILAAVSSGLGDVGGWILTNFVSLLQAALAGAILAGGAVYDAVVTYGPGILAAIGSGLGDLATWVTTNITGLLAGALTTAIAAGGTILIAVEQYGPGILSGILTGLGDMLGWVNTNIVQKIIDGLTAGIESVGSKAAEIGAKILSSIVGALAGLGSSIVNMINNAIPNEITIDAGILGSTSIDLPDDPIPGAAKGAHTRRGQPFWVGEEGMELFIPDTAGEIVPHDESMQYASAAFAMEPAFAYGGGGSGGDTYFDFHGPMNFWGVQDVRKLKRELEKEQRRQNQRGQV